MTLECISPESLPTPKTCAHVVVATNRRGDQDQGQQEDRFPRRQGAQGAAVLAWTSWSSTRISVSRV